MTKSSDSTFDMTRNSANKRHTVLPRHFFRAAPLWSLPAHLDRKPSIEPRPLNSGRRGRLGDDEALIIDRHGGAGPNVVDVADRAGVDASGRDRGYVHRRIVGLIALAIALAGSISLSVLAWLGVMTPALLLASCFTIGSGMALFGPAWQASVSEQVPAEALPSAVALNGIRYNIARSFGPAIGGVVVASAGAVAAFVTNALLYLPLLIVLLLWRRLKEPSRLPPERLARAVISGVRYIVHSPSIRTVLGRTLVTGIAGGSVSALSCRSWRATSCMAALKLTASCWGRSAWAR